MRYAHKAIGYKIVAATDDTCCYVKVNILNDTDINDGFLCVKFRSVPESLSSYPVKIEINGCDVPLKTRTGREITTADLYECIMLSGVYSSTPTPKYTTC